MVSVRAVDKLLVLLVMEVGVDRRRLLGLLALGAAQTIVSCGAQAPVPRPVSGSGRAKAVAPPRPVVSPPPLPPIPAPSPGTARQVFEVSGPGRNIVLTVDDGYDKATVAAYVRFCVDTGIHLTFSPNGVYAAEWEPHAAVLRPLIARGQVQIVNHTYSHANLRALSSAGIRREVTRNDLWVQRTFGITTRPWLRPPYGYRNGRTDAVAGELGYTRTLLWNGTLGDSAVISPQTLLAQARRYLQPGTIMLGHANPPTVTHLYDQLVTLIRDRQLIPLTLDEAFGTSRATG